MHDSSAGLWRNPDFIKLWMGQTISEFGSRITRDGLGLIVVITLSATPEQKGLFDALAMLPVLLFGFFAGVPVDRYKRRRIMIFTDFTRLFLLSSIPIAYLTGRLSIELLVIVAAAMGIIGIVFEAAYRAILPSVISKTHLLEGNTKLTTTDALAEIGGPAIAGLLIQVVGAPLAIVFDAVSYLFSGISFLMMHPHEAMLQPEPDEANPVSIWQEITAGLRFIMQDDLLRIIALNLSARNFFGSFYGTLYGLYAIRDLNLTPASLGLLIGCGGIGSLAGAMFSGALVRRFGMGRTMSAMLLASALVGMLTPLAGGSYGLIMVMMALPQLIGDAAMTVFQINELTLRQQRVPEHLLGRATASLSFIGEVVIPAGALISGVLAGVMGARSTLWIAVFGFLALAVWVRFSKLGRAEAEIVLIHEG